MKRNRPLLSAISLNRKLRMVRRFVPAGSLILEVGSGDGRAAQLLRRQGYTVTTLDQEPPADVIGDINAWQQLNLHPNSFDAVIAFELIEHVDCLEALQMLAKPGGFIILSSPHPKGDWAMKILERIGVNQKRTSAHINLTDFREIELSVLYMRRPLGIHQVAIFINSAKRV